MLKSYSELITIPDYSTRLEYLKLLDNNSSSPRGISREFYMSTIWKNIRREVMVRDRRFDLAVSGLYIEGMVLIHHINPIEDIDIITMSDKLTNLDNLVCTSLETHNAIHYKKKKEEYIERKPGDTKLW